MTSGATMWWASARRPPHLEQLERPCQDPDPRRVPGPPRHGAIDQNHENPGEPARPLAQGDWDAWTAAHTQPWRMRRSLSWSERPSWLTWILVRRCYRAVPRRPAVSPGG